MLLCIENVTKSYNHVINVKCRGCATVIEKNWFDGDGMPSALKQWFVQPDMMLELACTKPHYLDDWLAASVSPSSTLNRAVWNSEALGIALLAADGSVLASSQSFAAENAAQAIDLEAVAAAARSPSAIVRPVSLEQSDGRQHSALFAYASIEVARHWHIPTTTADLERLPPSAVVLITTVMSLPEPLRRSCQAFALTNLQERVVLSTIKFGSIKSAASDLGLAYSTAREALSQAFEKTGATGLTAMVSILAQTAFGVLPNSADAGGLLVDIWGLSERQATIACLIAEGHSRADAASLLGITDAVAKKEISFVFTKLHVSSAAMLSRMLAEASALSVMMDATGSSLGMLHIPVEPLRFVLRKDGTRIALSDYGPASGKTCFIVHSSMTTRLASRHLVKALQAQGYRPIAIDRPGFGMSDPVRGAEAENSDPFMLAAIDHAYVADRLKIGSASFVLRGGGRFIIALDSTRPDLVGRVVIANPDPQTEPGGIRKGPFGAFKEAYLRNPTVIKLMAHIIASSLNKERMRRMLDRALRGSPPDEEALQNEEIVEDLFRAGRMFATGKISGYIAEQIAFTRGGRPEPVTGKKDWHILLGEHDTLHDPQQVRDYWSAILPDSPFETVAGAGRLLAMTHSSVIARRLLGKFD